jgi:DNA-binding CsgD family transcriptional regulator/RimJ/RimL family protein N-acetyltransferase
MDDAAAWLEQHETDTPGGVDRWWSEPVWAITMGDDRWLGTVDLRPDGQGGASVGYLVAPWARGKGLATRALRLGCRWGFTALGLQVIQWRAGIGNDASRTVATRVGFHVAAEPQRRALAVRGTRLDCWFGDLLPDEVTEAGTGRRRQRSGPRLTARELEVLDQMAAGHSNRVIAATLGISENTVKNHVRRILDKLQAGSRMEAVVLSLRQGLTRLP